MLTVYGVKPFTPAALDAKANIIFNEAVKSGNFTLRPVGDPVAELNLTDGHAQGYDLPAVPGGLQPNTDYVIEVRNAVAINGDRLDRYNYVFTTGP